MSTNVSLSDGGTFLVDRITDAAEQRAQFTGGPDIGPEVLAAYLSGRASQPGWPAETGEPFRGAAEREWDDSRGGEP